MKKVRKRPGVLLVSVCGEHLLVATKEARESVPYVKQINGAAAYYWQLVEQEMDTIGMAEQVSAHFGMPKLKALFRVNQFLDKLAKAGYIIVEDEETAQ